MDRLQDLSKLVLVSGDSDFTPVLAKAKNAGIATVVVGAQESTAKQLIEAADEYLPLSKLDGRRAGVRLRPATHRIDETVRPVTDRRDPALTEGELALDALVLSRHLTPFARVDPEVVDEAR